MNAITNHPSIYTNQREEWQLRSAYGRIVYSFTNPKRAYEEGARRNLRVFHVVTLEREIGREGSHEQA